MELQLKSKEGRGILNVLVLLGRLVLRVLKLIGSMWKICMVLKFLVVLLVILLVCLLVSFLVLLSLLVWLEFWIEFLFVVEVFGKFGIRLVIYIYLHLFIIFKLILLLGFAISFLIIGEFIIMLIILILGFVIAGFHFFTFIFEMGHTYIFKIFYTPPSHLHKHH